MNIPAKLGKVVLSSNKFEFGLFTVHGVKKN